MRQYAVLKGKTFTLKNGVKILQGTIKLNPVNNYCKTRQEVKKSSGGQSSIFIIGCDKLHDSLKIADINSNKLSEGLGRCPKNPQGTSPLTHFRALPEPILAGRQEKGAATPFLLDRIIRELYVNRLSLHILAVGKAVCSGIPRFY